MKQLILVLFVALQMILSPIALAWSPLDELRSAVESTPYCASIVAGSESGQQGESEGEEEEEPDCD